MTTTERTTTVRELVPLLFVDDMGVSLAFYRDQLGFGLVNQWEPDGKIAWCRLERSSVAIMLQQACDEEGPAEGRGRGVGFFFNCDDADAMHAELREAGLNIEPPKLAFYGMHQLFLSDPDGYELCFQSPERKAT